MNRYILFRPATLLAIVLLSVFWIPPAHARMQGGAWSEPFRLSSDDGRASEGYLVADQYGYVHCFWTEALFNAQRIVIKYSRFNGSTWTKPNDIYVTSSGIRNVSPFVDNQGTLHIAWSEGLTGIAYYSRAPAHDAVSAQNWDQPIKIDVPARPVLLQVDSKGVLHILYTNQTEETGVYYIRSEDQGITWSEPTWLDPDILPAHLPDSLNFKIDENDRLHAAWVYGARESGARTDWVRYAHSFDGGDSWSDPVLIDRYDEESDHRLDFAGPNMVLQGQNVHIIWAAGTLPYRFHRLSTDAGLTWSTPVQVFGELHGQAFDGLAVDGAGRVHFFGQVRYPMGIYHVYWNQTAWSNPLLVYLISESTTEEIPEGGFGDRVHAHHTLPIIRAGNQIVLTFADGPADPNRRLFVMHRTLDDISPLEPATIPPTATALPMSAPTPEPPAPQPASTATAASLAPEDRQPSGPVPAPDIAIRVALVPTLLVLGLTMLMQWLSRRKD